MIHSNLYKPSELQALCARYDLTPSKKYGQNYLISEGVIAKIIDASGVSADDTIVEVGPGFGVLTLALAQRVQRVVAYEIERKLEPYWSEWQMDYPNIELVWGNVLYEFARSTLATSGQYRVVANLPYQITSSVVRTFLESSNPPTSMTIMVQREVAERIVAKPGDMSLLALGVQYYGVPRIACHVPAGNFWPAPRVDSAVVHIDSISVRSDGERLFRLARVGFANKRKQLVKNLSNGLGIERGRILEVFGELGIVDTVRAEELSVHDWELLTDRLG
jgi:16S rRNA (adenine1518-N6/adenine1519-N6)-dimethyltransferase